MGLDPLALAFQVAALLDDLGIPYAVGGAVASAIHGEPRATEDLGISAAIEPRHSELLIARLEAEYYVPHGLLQKAVAGRGSFNLIHTASARKVDVFVSGGDAFNDQAMNRRVLLTLSETPGRRLWVLSPEDTILQKLRWYLKGGGVSDRQWRDVVGVLKVQGERLDKVYLTTWADRLGLAGLLQKAFGESGVANT